MKVSTQRIKLFLILSISILIIANSALKQNPGQDKRNNNYKSHKLKKLFHYKCLTQF